MDISDWRQKIDDVDDRLVDLLNERARYVLEISKEKKRLGLPVHEPAREKEIMENIRKRNGGPLPYEPLKRIFERVIDESRSIQRGPMDVPRKDE
jgi:chorismate mutase